MAYKVLESEPTMLSKKKEFSFRKIFKIDTPNLLGKFGFSFCLGRKEFFVGIAVADIEIEKVIKRKKKKVIVRDGVGRIVDL